MNVRQLTLWGALLGASWLALSGERQPPSEIAQPIRISTRTTNAAQSRSGLTRPSETDAHPQVLELISRSDLPVTRHTTSGHLLFGTRSWAPPPPPPAPPILHKSPPPLPFQYIGKKWDGEQWTIFLARDDETLAVKTGETLDDTYRVHSIEPTELILEYLPLKQEQRLALE